MTGIFEVHEEVCFIFRSEMSEPILILGKQFVEEEVKGEE